MAIECTGVVEEVINNGKGKGSGIRIAGKKYGVYDPDAAGLGKIEEGMAVAFRYTEKDAGGGVVYKNLQGKITPMKPGSVVASEAPVAASTPRSGGVPYGGKAFPVPLLDGSRSIIRQNALTHATRVMIDSGLAKEKNINDLVAGILEVARTFEAYTGGDDILEAQKELESDVKTGFDPDA